MKDKDKETQNKGLHSGHRERMRTRFMENLGYDFADHELLDTLLFFSIPRVNTNETAHRLLDTFGSLENVFSADYKKLITVDGCKHISAFLIKLIWRISLKLNRSPLRSMRQFTKMSDVGQYLTTYFKGLGQEHFAIMLFDNSMNLIEFRDISRGDSNGAIVDPIKVARIALSTDAKVAIIAHNHLSGHVLPSSADRELTNTIDASLSAIGVFLLDHVIVSGNSYSATMSYRAGQGHSLWLKSDIDEDILKGFYFG